MTDSLETVDRRQHLADEALRFVNAPPSGNGSAGRKPACRRRWSAWLVGAAVFAFVSTTGASEASADNWMFRRSYYSHDVPPDKQAEFPRPSSRSAYRPAVRGSGLGFAAQGGYRYNRIFLRSGNSTDLTVIRQDWVEFTP